jgi:hypothetical protein
MKRGQHSRKVKKKEKPVRWPRPRGVLRILVKERGTTNDGFAPGDLVKFKRCHYKVPFVKSNFKRVFMVNALWAEEFVIPIVYWPLLSDGYAYHPKYLELAT